MKAQVIFARSQKNVSVFRHFMKSSCAKNKTDSEFSPFPSAKFRKTWQTDRLEYQFTLVGARFSGKSMGADFFLHRKKTKLGKNRKNCK